MQRLWEAAKDLQTSKPLPLLPAPVATLLDLLPSELGTHGMGGGGGVRCAGMCKPTGLRRRQRVRRDWRFLKTHVRPTVRSQDGAVSPQGPFPPLALTDWGPLGSQASWGTLTFRLGCFFRCTGQAKTGNPFQLISSYHHLLKSYHFKTSGGRIGLTWNLSPLPRNDVNNSVLCVLPGDFHALSVMD